MNVSGRLQENEFKGAYRTMRIGGLTRPAICSMRAPVGDFPSSRIQGVVPDKTVFFTAPESVSSLPGMTRS
jgi:hypothetical protein